MKTKGKFYEKIVILGCENSHASSFLSTIRKYEEFSDVSVIGVYSDERESCEKLKANYGVDILDDFADAVGKVDGVVITARNGINHAKYAAPYLDSGVPLYIDKPITNTEEDAISFIGELEKRGIRYTGGSCLRHDKLVHEIRDDRLSELDRKTLSGTVRAPLDSNSPYGGFCFYAPHLIETVMVAFGKDIKSVCAFRNGIKTTVIFRYDDYDVTGLFVENNYVYHITRHAEKSVRAEKISAGPGNDWIYAEFKDYYDILCGKKSDVSPEDFVRPVFVMNAIMRAIESGKEESVNEIKF